MAKCHKLGLHMFYTAGQAHNRIITIVCFSLSLVKASKSQNIERIKIMNIKSEWLENVRNTISDKKSGKFETKDKFGSPIILNWSATDIISQELSIFKKNVSSLAAQTTAATETEFLRIYPEAVNQEMFLKPCINFFANGPEAVNWKLVEEQIESTIKQFYLMDMSKFGEAVIKPLLDDIYFFATIKNKNAEEILGFIMFAITPALAYGDIKLINLAVKTSEQNRELDKTLISFIFKILPKTKRIFTGVRPTSSNIINRYNSYGFTQDLNPAQDPNHIINPKYFTILQYKAEQSNILQKIADTLIK